MGYGMKYKVGKKGEGFPFKSPLHENDDDKYKELLEYTDLEKHDDDVSTISGDHLADLATQGRVVDKPSKVGGSTDYVYKYAGKTPSGKRKIKIEREYDVKGKKGVPGAGDKLVSGGM